MDHRPKWKTQNFKLLEDKIRENLGDVGFGDAFKSSKAWSMIFKNKLTFIKLKISNEVDETRAYYTEWSKPETKTPILYTNAYIWNLERW